MFNSESAGDLHSRLREQDRDTAEETGKKPDTGRIRKVKALGGSVRDRARKKTTDFASVEHLSSDAVAGFVDNELSRGAMHRARIHLVHCGECREEISRQRDTSEYLRAECLSEEVSAPKDLMAKLAGIANDCAPGPGADELAMQRPDSFVAKVESVVRAVRRTQGR
ncbi:hypothetical protein [Corynebacterium pacaense]|uniref:hypothetical protein n=1 Tax=Corynebacterium pacaense TaxID=1816684 RepID=UPI0009B9EEE4|nr:hypothetical protein [Corynebacterium pacaense]